MIDLNEIECTGCTACQSICPKGAIRMEANQEGFKYPIIDAEKCIQCGLCVKVCKGRRDCASKDGVLNAYGAKAKNDAERKKSQSGGAFWVFAQDVICNGGIVYGVRMDDDHTAKHARAATMEELAVFRGSKYVQSDLGHIFESVKKDLEEKRNVLFSGTPCQIAGLNAFLQKQYANLLTIDLICHGVPSPKVWKDYIDYQKQKHQCQSLNEAAFRDKNLPWGTHRERLVFDGEPCSYDIYASLFYRHVMLRESCFKCDFTNLNRVSDITIGDFWGIEDVDQSFKDDYGISAILIHSQKGQALFETVKDQFHYFSCNVEDIAKKNPPLSRPPKCPRDRARFWSDYNRGIHYVINKYSSVSLQYKLKKTAYRILKKLNIR